MTAAPVPQPAPATSADLGHDIRFPVELAPGEEYRSGCHCHFWWELDPVEAEAALRGGWQ